MIKTFLFILSSCTSLAVKISLKNYLGREGVDVVFSFFTIGAGLAHKAIRHHSSHTLVKEIDLNIRVLANKVGKGAYYVGSLPLAAVHILRQTYNNFLATAREVQEDKMNKKVLIIYTGGTIGMKRAEGGYAPKAGYLAEAITHIPDLSSPSMPMWELYEMDPLLDSSDMTVVETRRRSSLFSRSSPTLSLALLQVLMRSAQ